MTLCAIWVRRVNTSDELVMASDSRLSGGAERWDGCPKLLTLPRSDSAICFAGYTTRTYPIMLQLYASIASFPDSRKRIQDFDDMKGHAVRLCNQMLRAVTHDLQEVREDFIRELRSSSFLIGGFSWRRGAFRLIHVAYDAARGEYVSHNYRIRRRTFIFIGDQNDDRDIPSDARKRLDALLKERGKVPAGYLDWEPFEVLRDMILQQSYASVGGPPQVTKIYRHMNCQPFAVYWPQRRDGQLTINGRFAQDYERTDWPRLDARTLEVSRLSLDDSDILF